MDVIDTKTLADRAFDRIADAIVRGELKPDERISEVALAKQFQISRGPLREALRRLEGRKLVVVKPNAGARVVSLSDRDITELFEIRESLESLACRLATERMTDGELDKLESLLDEHEKNPSAGRAASRASVAPDFHSAVVQGSRSRQLISLLCGELFDLMRVYRYKSSGKEGRAPTAFHEHREIFAAMRDRDPDRAVLLMAQHIRNARANVLWAADVNDALVREAAIA